MKSLLRAVVALVVLAGPASAQTITGNWQGVLQAGRDLRIVITITEADGGVRGVMYLHRPEPAGRARDHHRPGLDGADGDDGHRRRLRRDAHR